MAGWFAGVVMILMGAWHAVDGLGAVGKPSYSLVGKTIQSSVDYTAGGWVDLVVGVVVVLAGARWARVVGICLAGLSAILNITFLVGYPF